MKKLKNVQLLILFWSISHMVFAQSAVRPLNIGDRVPDIEFKNFFKKPNIPTKLSDYKGKLVILDLMATWCPACIHTFPKFDSLQKEFNNDLVIMAITAEKKEALASFLDRVPELRDLSFNYLYEMSLMDFFPFRLLPHEVWIDKDGVVLAITNVEDVTRENIRKVISGEKVTFTVKKDIVKIHDDKPLLLGRFEGYQFQPKEIKYSSLITSGTATVATSAGYQARKKGDYITIKSNRSLLQNIYKTALATPNLSSNDPNSFQNKDFYLMKNNRLIWEAKDTSLRYLTEEDRKRALNRPYEEFTFNYELIVPLSDSLIYKDYMLQDLNRYFGSVYNIIGAREKRLVKCYSLTQVGSDTAFRSKGGTKKITLKKGAKGFKVVNYHIDELLMVWLGFYLPYDFPIPVINETGYDGRVDLDLGDSIDPTDFHSVNAALSQYGLEFKLVEREIEMIIIKDKNNKL